MIEIDGTAIPLEPGQHYLLVYDVNRIDPVVLDSVDAFLKDTDIRVCWFPINGRVDGVRLVKVEGPELIEVRT